MSRPATAEIQKPGTSKKGGIARLAWIGAPGAEGVGEMCHLFLRELAALDIDLDVYANGGIEEFPDLISAFQGKSKRLFEFPFQWNWNAWYGRNRKVAFVMSFLKRLPIYDRMVDKLLAEHTQRPYDAIIQFSQGELFKLGRHAARIPIILYPCVHAGGERFWCRKETNLARRCEPFWWRVVRDQYLGYRVRAQKRDYSRARGVIGMSRRFNRWVERDYGLASDRFGVVYHPTEPVSGGLHPIEDSGGKRTIKLLFVGRISVRKGVEMLVESVPTLLARHRDAEVTIIGAGSLWSDYECLLASLPNERCRWLKALPNDKVQAMMREADILLVPSRYEPGGIVVGEALTNGMIVVASDEVGSAENLPASICKQFRAGDLEDFHVAIESAIAEVRSKGFALREEASQVARKEFDPRAMTKLLLTEAERLLSRVDAAN